MRRAVTGCLAVAVLWGVTWAVAAQEAVSARLADMRSAVEREVSEQLAGWAHRSVEPMEWSGDTTVNQWHSGRRIIKVSLTLYASAEDAAKALKEFRSHVDIEDKVLREKGKQGRLRGELSDVGEGGFAWDVFGSEAVAFRKGALLGFVSVLNADEETDQNLSREVARLVDKALRSN